MTSLPDRAFHAVETMREVRDDLSRQLRAKSYGEQRRFVREQLQAGDVPTKRSAPRKGAREE
jgi:hypothetical protein